jgi:hypothetical protein
VGKFWRCEKGIRVDGDTMIIRELNELLNKLNGEGDGEFLVEAWFDGRGFVRVSKCLVDMPRETDSIDYFGAPVCAEVGMEGLK